MSQTNQNIVNISTPSLLNICIDERENGELQGRVYHYYDEECICFHSVLELIRIMESLFNELDFPQASTKLRSFRKETSSVCEVSKKGDKKVSWEKLSLPSGKIGTFITCVKFRQNSSWQGDFVWKEEQKKTAFSSALEFIYGMNEILESR